MKFHQQFIPAEPVLFLPFVLFKGVGGLFTLRFLGVCGASIVPSSCYAPGEVVGHRGRNTWADSMAFG